MKKLILIPLFLVIALAMIAPNTYATTIKFAFVFADRFPDEAGPLGFTTGNVVQVGAMVKAGDSPITKATATNLDTGHFLLLIQTSTKVFGKFGSKTKKEMKPSLKPIDWIKLEKCHM